MTDFAIRAEHISKQFQLGANERGYKTFREAIVEAVKSPLQRFRQLRGDSEDQPRHWALKDVSFEIRPGEVVGIIGRNGAGKSTLLKVLSRITEPSGGKVKLRGRVASLLEVGTGFHPELSGRENVFLNGAVLGMSRREIERSFDEIVAFAEVEKFIDTPVKRYSSGMYLRLAFAVAAHLQPEILIIDEVLAVGDQAFQKKCLNKMEDVSHQGRTVLFVSHNMPAVTRLCPRTILLDSGRVLRDGPSHEVVSAYLNSGLGTTAVREWPDLKTAPGNQIARLRAVRIRNEQGELMDACDIRRPIRVDMDYQVLEEGHVLVPHFSFHNEEGLMLFVAVDQDKTWQKRPRPKGFYTSSAWIPGNLLAEGTVVVGTALTTHIPFSTHYYERDAVAFQVMDTMEIDSARADYGGHFGGMVRPRLNWQTQYEGETVPDRVPAALGV